MRKAVKFAAQVKVSPRRSSRDTRFAITEYVPYLTRAYGSAEETIEHLRYLLETGSAQEVADECRGLIEEYSTLCRKLFNYQQAVFREHNPERGHAMTPR